MNVGIGPDMQVNEVIRLHPATVRVFQQAGIDSCCGGALPVAEAARRHEIELEGLLAELMRAVEAQG